MAITTTYSFGLFTIKLIGHEKLAKEVKKSARVFPIQITKNLRSAGRLIQRSIVNDFMKGSRSRAARTGQQRTATKGILGIDRGVLRSSIGIKGPIQIGTVSFLEVGTMRFIPYALIHERGGYSGKDGKTRIPKRPFVSAAVDLKSGKVFKLLGKTFKVIP